MRRGITIRVQVEYVMAILMTLRGTLCDNRNDSERKGDFCTTCDDNEGTRGKLFLTLAITLKNIW